jgi:hypothetical protein
MARINAELQFGRRQRHFDGNLSDLKNRLELVGGNKPPLLVRRYGKL